MSGEPATTAAACSRCPADADDNVFTGRGDLAAHLVESHNVGASQALRDARAAFGIADPPPTPHPRGPAPAQTPGPAQEETMPKKKKGAYTCSRCQKPGHSARTCSQVEKTPPKRRTRHLRRRSKPVRLPPLITGASESGEIAANARERARTMIRTKLAEELAWAKAYLAELERLAGEA